MGTASHPGTAGDSRGKYQALCVVIDNSYVHVCVYMLGAGREV